MKRFITSASRRRIVRDAALTGLLTALIFTPAILAGQSGAPQRQQQGFPDLVGALKATPGCIGVETARTSGGKQVIFVWFEDKKAVLNWYYSETHQNLVKQFFPAAPAGTAARKPMGDVPDEGPVLAIASLTMSDKPQGDATSLPVSQIAIELYRPLPGGLALGGRFAPAALKVPGLQVVPMGAPPKEHQ